MPRRLPEAGVTENAAAATGARVREARKWRGLTQQELASASGLSISLITKLEQGAHGGIRLETAHKLAIVLRVTTTALMSEPDAPPR
jgi:transcriptional regulator with XRE-family HTH domain